jgi:hypothetical protein
MTKFNELKITQSLIAQFCSLMSCSLLNITQPSMQVRVQVNNVSFPSKVSNECFTIDCVVKTYSVTSIPAAFSRLQRTDLRFDFECGLPSRGLATLGLLRRWLSTLGSPGSGDGSSWGSKDVLVLQYVVEGFVSCPNEQTTLVSRYLYPSP